jgi:hypothetical protein
MTGFLHRAVSGILQPKAALHPFVQPIFAAPSSRSDRESMPGRENVAVVPSVLNHPASIDGALTAEPARIGQPPSLIESFMPIASVEQSRSSRVDHSEKFNIQRPERFAQGNIPLFTEGQSPREAESVRTSEAIPSLVSEYVPLIDTMAGGEKVMNAAQSSSLIPQRREDLGSVRSDLARMNLRRQASQQAAAPPAIPTQPDEIQVHIGRIEVIAVPQAATRPAAPAVRRGVNLDDYLSRSNGRSR